MRCARGAWALSLACACSRSTTLPDAGVEVREAAAMTSALPSVPPAESTSAAPEVWRGTYRSMAGTLYVPAELKVSWKPTDATAGIGEGTLSLTADPRTGRVRGDLDGPLGPAAVSGLVTDGKLTATIARKDPSDHGFAGTMIGTVGPDGGDGAMNVSLAEGGAIRTATFVVSAGGSPVGTPR